MCTTGDVLAVAGGKVSAAPIALRRNCRRSSDVFEGRYVLEVSMLKVIGWIVGIIFLIGLLVVFGIFDLIF
jgi:hypothetical protein